MNSAQKVSPFRYLAIGYTYQQYNPCLGETPEDWFYSVMTYAYILSKEFKQDSTTISIFGWNNKPVSIVYVRHDNE